MSERNQALAIFIMGIHIVVFWGAVLLINTHYNNNNLEIAIPKLGWREQGGSKLSDVLKSGDTSYYIRIASEGYNTNDDACAFYPLLPHVLRLLSIVSGCEPFVCGIVFINAVSCVMLYMGYTYCEKNQGKGSGIAWLVLIQSLPGSIYLNLVYTESLFMLLAIYVFILMRDKMYVIAGAVSILLPLTKAVGILIIMPIALHLYINKEPLRYYALLFLPLFGYIFYYIIMYLWTGNPFEGFKAQQYFPTKPSVQRLLDLRGFTEALLTLGNADSQKYSWLDRAHFLLLIILHPILYNINKPVALFGFLIGIISAMSTLFISFTRHYVTCLIGVTPLVWDINRMRAVFPIVITSGLLKILMLKRYLEYY